MPPPRNIINAMPPVMHGWLYANFIGQQAISFKQEQQQHHELSEFIASCVAVVFCMIKSAHVIRIYMFFML